MTEKPVNDNMQDDDIKTKKDKTESRMVNNMKEAERKMKNDLMEPSLDLGSHDLSQIAELSKYKIERAKAQEWASMDIKFLVYDDTDVKVDGYDSDDEEGMLNFATEMCHQDSVDRPGYNVETSEPAENSSSSKTHTNDSQDFACRICSSYPEFPHKWKPRKFRLVKPTLDHPELFNTESVKSVDVCMHYVAISYCWPPHEEMPTPREYQVRDLDGSIRSNRALDDVLDRAVDFANSCGLRMIWIDQECLPQPTQTSSKADWDEQELGIQSMDIIYNRAMVTAGLLSVEISIQEQLTAIEALLYFDQIRRQSMINQQFFEYLLDFLRRTSRDRWYTRAWVVQEALCAGDKLVLAFRRSSGLTFPSHFRYGYKAEREDRPYHSLDDTPRKLGSNLVCLRLTDFWMIVDDMKYFLKRDFMNSGDHLIRFNFRPGYIMPDAQSAIEAADSLHPRFVKANTLQQNLKVYFKGHYGKRPTINAAGALTLLKHRHCYYDSDRLAIVANMCDYDFRLDTKAVDRNCNSLSQAIFALALNNGDLSLLVPEVYLPWNYIYSDESYNGHPERSVLFQDFLAEAPRVDHCRVRNFINFRLQRPKAGDFTSAGLKLPAYLWLVDVEVDFTPIQAQWADSWESLRCWRITVDRKKNETLEQFNTRQNAIVQRFSQPGIAQQALQEFRIFGLVPNDSVVWEGIDNAGVIVRRSIESKRVERVSEIRDMIARIIFDTLRYTLSLSDDVQCAQGLANSIWQSVRIDQVPGSEELLPDEVNDNLFSHRDVLIHPFATLQLDETADGNLAQLWFVDRIMEKGRLWCGHYQRSGRQLGNSSRLSSHADSPQERPSIDLKMESFPSASHSSHSSQTDSKLQGPETKSIISRQISRQMIAMVAQSGPSGSINTKYRYAMATLTDVASTNYWSEDAEKRREESLMSAFDVDGPCQIATPYNPEWEILPHPDLRSMSVCWVFEPKDDGLDSALLVAETLDDASNEIDADMDHQGMVKENVKEKTRGKEKASENSGNADSTDTYRSINDLEDQAPAFRVLRKVRGLWQIMDLPSQEYVFS
jgi:hypothetical protein